MLTLWMNAAISLLAVSVLAAAPGCIIVTSKDSQVSSLPEGRYTGAIRAAQSVSYSGDRTATYRTIAAKPDIQECDQKRLVYALTEDSGFSSDKTEATLTLIQNPAITPGTKSLIGKHVDDLAAFSADRSRIAQALAN